MVAFNPENQSQSMPFINWARPTSEPKPDVSGEIRGKAIEQGLQGGAAAIREGAQGITAAYEKGIQNTIYAGVDPLRDDYMSQLHSTDELLQGRGTPDPLGRDAPRDVKQLGRTLETFDSARANGKLSQTDYDARLNSLAKEVRAKYPGYRQYVDEEFKRITGRDSANQYIRSVIQDIDSFIAGRQAKRDQLETKLMGEGLKFPGADQVIAAYKKNPEVYGPTALHWLNEHLASDHILQEHRANISAMEAQEKLNTDIENKGFDQAASSSAGHAWNGALHSLVMSADLKNPKWTRDLQEWERTGIPPRDMSSEEGVAMASWLTMNGESFAAQRAKDLTEMVTPQASGGPAQSGLGPAPLSRITSERIQKQVKAEKELYWDHVQDALSKGNLPLALRATELVKARSEDAQHSLMTNPEFGDTLTTLSAVEKLDKNTYNTAIMGLEANKYFNEHYGPSIVRDILTLSKPPEQGGRPLSQVIQESQIKNIADGSSMKSRLEVLSNLGKTGKQAVSSEAREALINNVFGDPNGAQVLQSFVDDRGVRAQAPHIGMGRVLGRQYVFDQMYSEANIKATAKMAKEKPELYDKLVSSATANTTVMMPREYLQTPTVPFNPKTGEPTKPAPTVTYNNSSQTFSIRGQPGLSREEQREFDQIAGNVHKLAVIAQHNPNVKLDPTMVVFHYLYDTYKDQVQPHSMVDKMLSAIRASYEGGVGFKDK